MSLLQQRRSEVGFTLVELLVAMLLGVTLLFGVTQLFNNGRESVRLQTAMASIQDGGRIAIELLSRDIRNADFSGCLRDRTLLTNGLQGFTSGSNYEYFDLPTVAGQVADGTLSFGDGKNKKTVVANTHTLQIVTAQPVCEGTFNLAADQGASSDDLTLSGACPGGIKNGTVLMVNNCRSGEIFIKTGGTGPAIEHGDIDKFDGVGNASKQFRELYGTDSSVFQPLVYTYFVAPGQNTSNALFRMEDNTIYELIPNVDNFELAFGIDNDGDLAVEQFVDPAAVVDPEQIIAVRTTLEIHSSELIQGNPMTRTFTATTNIRNRTAPGS